jgi:lincosamide nucleotidyltransferase A/C/D/E
MDAKEVIDIYTECEKNGVRFWIDGGWGVDSLLGQQTRPHKDLDIAIQSKDVPKFLEILTARKYKKFREDSMWNVVFRDEIGHEVDYHSFVVDENGNVVGGIMYPATSLSGSGLIEGYVVRCIAPKHMIEFHSGYKLTEKDFRDVSALCKKFDIPLPEAYTQFINK